MTEKTICSEYSDTEQIQTTKVLIPDYLKKREMKIINIFLGVINKHDDTLIERLLPNYKETLNKMNINSK
ncbi:MAG TPA: hypothetical protein VMX17_15915, partial [Candidatus Glassbacteria bacterium]|nr:hypothetical protein [Candidatus Glassbacteria bacterium]